MQNPNNNKLQGILLPRPTMTPTNMTPNHPSRLQATPSAPRYQQFNGQQIPSVPLSTRSGVVDPQSLLDLIKTRIDSGETKELLQKIEYCYIQEQLTFLLDSFKRNILEYIEAKIADIPLGTLQHKEATKIHMDQDQLYIEYSDHHASLKCFSEAFQATPADQNYFQIMTGRANSEQTKKLQLKINACAKRQDELVANLKQNEYDATSKSELEKNVKLYGDLNAGFKKNIIEELEKYFYKMMPCTKLFKEAEELFLEKKTSYEKSCAHQLEGSDLLKTLPES